MQMEQERFWKKPKKPYWHKFVNLFKYISLISFLILFIQAYTQSDYEKIKLTLANAKTDQDKVDALNDLALYTVNNNPDESRQYALQALKLAQKISYQKGVGYAYYNLGNINYYLDEFEPGYKNLDSAKKIFIQINDPIGIANTKNTFAEIKTLEGEYATALNNLFDALKLFDETKDSIGLAKVNNNIGLIHYHQKNYPEAIKYFNQALKTADLIRTGDAYLYIGRANVAQNNYSEAEKNLENSLRIALKTNDNYILSDTYYLLGKIKAFYGEYDMAMKHTQNAIKIKESLDDNQGMALCCIQMANLNLNTQHINEALNYFYKAKKIAQQLYIREELKDTYLGLSNTYNYLKLYDSAYLYLNEHNKVQAELLSEEASEKLAQLEATLASQRRETEIQNERKLQRFIRKIIISASVAVIIMLLIFAFMMYSRYKLKNKANQQLEKYNAEIIYQRDIIKQKQEEIIDSINYAKRIQYALLAHDEFLNNNLKDYFVLFKPKDIVSGDFYWATKKNNDFYIAVCDSTGHGVPGAFMSLLNISFLNEAINEKNITNCAEVLNHVRNRLIQNMDNRRDGMDAILMKINLNHTAVIEYAAANNRPVLIRNNQISEQPCDKMPVGKSEKTEKFNTYKIQVQKNDMLYLYTDGYADQFGGEKGKKLKYKILNTFLAQISSLTTNEQKEKLENYFNEWKRDMEQIDDVCVVGIRI